jgi:hypothetical protein
LPAKFRFGAADAVCIAIVALIGGGMFAFRWFAIMPVWTVGACAAAGAPGFCAPRELVLKLQYYQGFGWAAFALGLAAFILGWRLAAAFSVAIGIAAVVNYNGTTGILGAALGLTAWLSLVTGRYSG